MRKIVYIVISVACFLSAIVSADKIQAQTANLSKTNTFPKDVLKSTVNNNFSDKTNFTPETNVPESWGQRSYTDRNWRGEGRFAAFTPEQEVLSKRDENSKHFLKPDGTQTAVISQGPVHYKDGAGNWQDIRTDIRPNTSGKMTDYPYAVTENKHQVYLPQTIDDGYLVQFSNGGVKMGMQGEVRLLSSEHVPLKSVTRTTANGSINDNTLKYTGTYPFGYDELTLGWSGVEHDIILNEKPVLLDNAPAGAVVAFREFVRLPENWKIINKKEIISMDCGQVAENRGLAIIDEQGTIVGEILTPYIHELNQRLIAGNDPEKGPGIENREESTTGTFRIEEGNGGYYIETCVAASWLNSPDRVYPVVIDPTINCYPQQTGSLYTGWNYNASHCFIGFLVMGDYLFWVSNYPSGCNPIDSAKYNSKGYMYFNTASITDGSTINSVVLNYNVQSKSSGTPYYRIRGMATLATSCATRWTNETTGTIYQTYTSLTTTGWKQHTLGATANSDLASRLTSNYFGVAFDEYETAGCYWVKTYGYTSEYRPYITVDYCTTPGTPASASGTPTGPTAATLSWSAGTPVGSPTVTYYWVVGTSPTVTYGSGIDQGTATSSTATTTLLSCGTTYYLRVYASTNCNGTSSAYVTSAAFTTSPCQMMVPATGNNSYTACSGHLYDNGGSAADYANSSSGYTVIYPSIAGNMMTVSGTLICEGGWDYLTIYDGAGTSGNTLWGGGPHGSGTTCSTFTVPATTSTTGPLTIAFYSDMSNACGGFDLTLSCAAGCIPATNEDCSNAINISSTATPYNTSGTLGCTDDCSGQGYFDVFYTFTPAYSGSYTADMGLSNGDTYMRVFSGSCCGTLLGSDDDSYGDLDPSITLNLIGGTTYYFECGSFNSTGMEHSAYNFNLVRNCTPPANETCATAREITFTEIQNGYFDFGNLGCADDCTGTPYHDVFYRYDCTCTGSYTFDMGYSDGDTYMNIYSGSCGGTPIVSDDDSYGDWDPLITLTLTAGTSYWIECGSWSSGDYMLGTEYIFYASTTCGNAPNDLCSVISPSPLTVGSSLTFNADNQCATTDCSLVDWATTWHAFTISECADVVIDFCGTTPSRDVGLVLTQQCTCSSLIYASNYDAVTCPDGNYTIYFNDLPAGTYYYPVLSDFPDVGPYTLHVTANPAVAAPVSAAANPTAINSGNSSILSAGVGSGGDQIQWFTGGCGTTPAGTGTSLTVFPTVTTTYYVRTYNSISGCSGPCVTVTVTVNPSGHVISGKTRYLNKAIAGNPAPALPTYNAAIYNINKVIAVLKNYPAGTEVARDTSDATGAYQFSNIPNGNYILYYDKYVADTMQSANDISAIDVALLKYLIGFDTLVNPSRSFTLKHKKAANVDNNVAINAVDISRIKAKIGAPYNPTANFPKGNWVAFDTLITMAGADLNIVLKTVNYGDYDASSTKYRDSTATWGTAKSGHDNIIAYSEEAITTNNAGYFEIPLRISTKMNELSALGLELSYPENDYELVSAYLPRTVKKEGMVKINPSLEEIIANDKDLLVTDYEGIIRVVFATTNHFDVAANDELITLVFKPLRPMDAGAIDFTLSGTGVIADQYGVENEDAFLIMPKVYVQGNNMDAGFEFAGYPNPFSGNAILTYNLPENGNVNISVYNAIGELVKELINETQTSGKHSVEFFAGTLPAGMYTFKLDFAGRDNEKCLILKMVH